MRKTSTLAAFGCGIILAGGLLASCNKDTDLSGAGKTSTQSDQSLLPEQGINGAKAAHGGGGAPQPETAKPGQKTGTPK